MEWRSNQPETTLTEGTAPISKYTFLAKVSDNAGLSLGYHVSMEVNVSAKEVLAVPEKSVIVKDGVEKVFVVNNGKAKLKSVNVGDKNAGWFEIKRGLKSGEKIIENPSSNLQDGQVVTSDD